MARFGRSTGFTQIIIKRAVTQRQTVFTGTTTDTLLGADTATRAMVFARTATDTLLGSDAATRTVARFRTTTDTLLGSDAATRSLALARTTTDTLLGSDSATRSVAFARTTTDTLLGTDSAVGVVTSGQFRHATNARETTIDDFNRANAANPGANWTLQTGVGTLDDTPIVSNKAKYTGTNGTREQWVGTSFLAGPDIVVDYIDTSSQVTGGSDHWVAARWDATDDTWYGFLVDQPGGTYILAKFVLGVFTSLDTGAYTHVSGQRIRLSVIGNRIRAYQGSTLISSVLDTSIPDNERRFGWLGINAGADYLELDTYQARNVGAWVVADRGSLANVVGSTSEAVDMAAAASITVGNYLFIRIACDNAAAGASPITGVSDARNGAWTLAGTATNNPSGANTGVTVAVYYVKVVTAYANGDDVTIAFSTSTAAKAAVIEELTNLNAFSPIAVPYTTATGTTSPSSGTAPVRAPQFAEQTAYGALAAEGPNADSYTEDADVTNDAPWRSLTRLGTTDATAANNVKISGATKTVNGSTSETWDPTITSRDWASVLFVLDIRVEPDTLLGADTATGVIHAFARTASDTLLGSDTATRTLVLARTATDTLLGSDTATRAMAFARTTSDTLVGADTATRAAQSFSRTATDTLLGSDTATRSLVFARSTSDTLLGSDTATRSLALARTTTDSLLGADTATKTQAFPGRTCTDVLLAPTSYYRSFVGPSDGIFMSLGAGAGLSGAVTMAVVARSAQDGGPFPVLLQIGTNAGSNYWMLYKDPGANQPSEYNGTTGGVSSTTAVLIADGWDLIVVTRAAGTSTPRFHIYKYATQTWTHENSSTSNGNTTPAGSSSIGTDVNTNTGTWTGDIAYVAAGAVNLSDAQVETMLYTQTWSALLTNGLWPLNQASVGTAVTDATGNGANETSHSGTTANFIAAPPWLAGDIATRSLAFARSTTDSLLGADTATRATQSFARTATDTLLGSDTATRTAAFARTATDTLLGADSADGSVVAGTTSYDRTATDTLLGSDTATRSLALARTATDSLLGSDTATRSVAFARTATDALLGWREPTVTDSFNRADSAVSMGSTDGGQVLAWTPGQGTWGIASNRAYLVSGGGDEQNVTVVETGQADGTLQVTFTVASGEDGPLSFRYSDNSNYWLVSNYLSQYHLFKKVVGAFTDVAAGGSTAVNGDVVSVVLNGSSIVVKVNGSTVISYSDSFNASATKHGLRLYGGSPGGFASFRADDWSFTGVPVFVEDVATRALAVVRTATDTLLGSDTATRSLVLARTATDTLLGSDTATKTLVFARTTTDTLVGADTATRATLAFSRTTTDTLLGADTATRTFVLARTTSDALLGSDTATRTFTVSRTTSDTLLGSDTATRALAFARTTTDTLLGTDTATRTVARFRTATDTLLGSDTATRSLALARTTTDTLLGTDVASTTPVYLVTASDTLLGTDTATRAAQLFTRTATDSLLGTDTATRTLTVARTTTDSLLGSDTATRSLTLARTTSDTLLGADTATRTRISARTTSDTLLGADTATTTPTSDRTGADTLLGADTATRTTARARTTTDTLLGADTATRTTARNRTTTDTLLGADTASATLTRARTTTDSLLGTDTATRTFVAARTTIDTLLGADTGTTTPATDRTATDTLLGADTATVVFTRIRTTTDALLGGDTCGRTLRLNRFCTDHLLGADTATGGATVSSGIGSGGVRVASGHHDGVRVNTDRHRPGVRTGPGDGPGVRVGSRRH